jgi:hypothetical protein
MKSKLNTVAPTEDMITDYMTKPLVGVKFEHFSKLIINLLSLPRWPAGVWWTIYQSHTQSRYFHNNHYDHNMTQKPKNNVLMNTDKDILKVLHYIFWQE